MIYSEITLQGARGLDGEKGQMGETITGNPGPDVRAETSCWFFELVNVTNK